MSQRTPKQNNAMYLWHDQVAQTLNDAGFTLLTVLRHDAEIPWSKHAVKEYLWLPIQRAYVGKEHTSDCGKLDYAIIEQILAQHLAEKLGVELPPWPSEESNAPKEENNS